jgi:thiol peroxidase
VLRFSWILLVVACSRSVSESDVVDYLRTQPPAARELLVAKADARPERTDVIKRGDSPLTLVGKTLEVGDAIPDVALADGKLAPIQLGSFKGKIVVLSVVPSIDTRVCETQTHKVNDAMGLMPKGVEVFTVSRDLPFAQTRFAEEAVILHKMASDYHGGAFGRAFGLDVKESGLLARSVWVIGADGKVAYRQIVEDQGTEPDYDALVAAVKRSAGA